jgi:hypothetical protein
MRDQHVRRRGHDGERLGGRAAVERGLLEQLPTMLIEEPEMSSV